MKQNGFENQFIEIHPHNYLLSLIFPDSDLKILIKTALANKWPTPDFIPNIS